MPSNYYLILNLPLYGCMNSFYSPPSLKPSLFKFSFSSPPHHSQNNYSNSQVQHNPRQNCTALHSITNMLNSPISSGIASDQRQNSQYVSLRCRRKQRECTVQGSQNLTFQSVFIKPNKEQNTQYSRVRFQTQGNCSKVSDSFTHSSVSTMRQDKFAQRYEKLQSSSGFKKPCTLKQNLAGKKINFSRIRPRSRRAQCKLSNARIQDFHVGQMIGKGSIGRVFLAKHKKTSFYFALKIINKKDVKDINQLSLGIKCHAFLNHPNIAQLYACFNDKDCVYLLMQLCIDNNLSKYSKRIKNDEEKDRIVMGITKGVKYMHSYFLRHGDLKLENVLISHGFPKISDFDCIFNCQHKASSYIRRRSKLWGSPAYFSPSMMKESVICLDDDIWSIGVITYQLYCSSHPFNLKDTDDLAKIVSQEMNPIYNVKQSTKALILSMLEKNKQKRATIEQIQKYFT